VDRTGAWQLTKQTFREWDQDNVPRLAAALAYYTLFSIAPLLVIAIALAGAIFGPEAARGEVSNQLRELMGPAAAEAVERAVRNASRHETTGALATVFGVVVLIWGATGVFAELQGSLNAIWKVTLKPDLGWLDFFRMRLFSFAMVLALAFVLLVSLVISAALSALNNYLRGGAGTELLWQGLNLAASLVVFSLLFAMIYKVLPDRRIGWEDVWVGAVITALLFSIGKSLLGIYLGHSSLASVYGAAGSLVILLVWVYYSSQLILLGAEFTKVYARRYRHSAPPDVHAVRTADRET
jgi:membrane protein